MFKIENLLILFNKLGEFLKDACIDINKRNPGLNKYLKKEFMVKSAQDFYDQYVDQTTLNNPGGRIPAGIDYGIKYMLIPFLSDCIVAELKSLGIII